MKMRMLNRLVVLAVQMNEHIFHSNAQSKNEANFTSGFHTKTKLVTKISLCNNLLHSQNLFLEYKTAKYEFCVRFQQHCGCCVRPLEK